METIYKLLATLFLVCLFNFTIAQDNDLDGVPDAIDLDDDNDGILDVNEKINGSSTSPITKLGMAHNFSNGVYYFKISGVTFRTYIENGYVLVALDEGDGVGNLSQTTYLTGNYRGVLSPTVLATLTDATEVKFSYSGSPDYDLTNTDQAIIDKIINNQTIHRGAIDKSLNNNWQGSNANILNSNTPYCNSSLGSNLEANVFHLCGDGNSMIWAPSLGMQRVVHNNGEIADTHRMYLWIKAPSSSIEIDIDNDGVFNHLDIDSDGDGCPDAIEGNGSFMYANLTTSLNFADIDEGSVDTTGIPTIGQQDIGSANDINTQPDECDACNPSSSLFADIDNDGIGNECDLDNDNDGILDIDECYQNTILDIGMFDELSVTNGENDTETITYKNNTVTLTLINEGTGTIIAKETGAVFSSRDPSGDGSGIQVGTSSLTNLDTSIVRFEFSVPVSDLTFVITDIDFGNLSGPELTIIEGSLDGNVITLITNNIEVVANSSGPRQTQNNFNGGGANASNVIRINFSSKVDKLEIKFTGTQSSPVSLTQTIFNLTYSCDADGDGIPNILDLDSDNDGCSDAIEGGATTSSAKNFLFNISQGVGNGDENGNGLADVIEDLPGNPGEANYTVTYQELALLATTPFTSSSTAAALTDIVNSWGASWGDYDNDGFEDLFVPGYDNNQSNMLYHNEGDGTFTKITQGSLVEDLGSALSGTWADYDNDGDLDILVANGTQANNNLYKNNGDGTFSRVLNDPIAEHAGYSFSASWADYDNDGYLDLFVADYMPTNFNALFHNNGDGSFTKVTNSPVVTHAGYSIGASWADYDNDGDLDLFVTNTNLEDNLLYRNDGGAFTEITSGNIVSDGGSSVGSSWADYDNDGDLDLFVANAGNQNNLLYQNNGDGTFTKNTSSPVTTSGGHSHGSAWADYDNDGDLDLFVTNDQGNNFVYENNGNGIFESVDNDVNGISSNSYGTSWADYDNDGDLDLFVSTSSSELNELYVNEKGLCNTYGCIRLVGTTSNKTAIGAKVKVKTTIDGNSIWQMREISAQTGGGAGGQNTMRAMFGLGSATTIDSIIIEWPSGYNQYLGNQLIDNCIEITEPEGTQVCGTVYNDINASCSLDSNDNGVANMRLSIAPINRIISTNSAGQFSTYLPNGDYTFSIVKENGWDYGCIDSSFNVAINGENQLCGHTIGVYPNCSKPDLKVELGTSALRRGFKSIYTITVSNIGAVTSDSSTLNVLLNEYINPIEASIDWISSTYDNGNNVVVWDLPAIKAGQQLTIFLTDSVTLDLSIEDTVVTTAIIQTDNDECSMVNNEIMDIQPIVGAIDPNDKLTLHKSVGPLGYIRESDTLHYKIRFQNTGNYEASRVVVIDSLSRFLDISTIHGFTASHKYNVNVSETGIITWKFINIDLPDSNTNEEASHGYVTFKVLPKKDLPEYAMVLNNAYIQFDFNAFIKTNTVVNTIVENIYFASNDLIKFTLFPNPAQNETSFKITTKDGQELPNTINRVDCYSTNGILTKALKSEVGVINKMNTADLNPGVYFIIAYDEYGYQYKTRLVKM